LEPIRFQTSGRATIKLAYSPKSITGEMGMGGQTTPVHQTLEAPVFAAGPAFDAVLSGLPLADGYQTTYRVFEASTQKVRPMRLKVSGAEQVSVKAGSFDTWVVEVQPLDGDDTAKATFHVPRTAPHQLVTATGKLPATMGGGTMKTELTSVAAAENVTSK